MTVIQISCVYRGQINILDSIYVCAFSVYVRVCVRVCVCVTDCALARTDLVIIIDSSTSVTAANFQKILNFIKDFVRASDIDSGNVRVGVVLYSTEVGLVDRLTGGLQMDSGLVCLSDSLKRVEEVCHMGQTSSFVWRGRK